MSSGNNAKMVFTWTIFDSGTGTVRTGGSVLPPIVVRRLEVELNRLGADEYTAEYRYGNDTDLSEIVRYEDYVALTHEFGADQVRRAYFALVRYALRNPDRLNAVCPVCRRHISKRCGEYTTERIDWQPKPYIGLASLIALNARDARSLVKGYGPKAYAVTEAVIKHVQAGREA